MTEAIVQEVSKIQDRHTLRELEFAIKQRRAEIKKEEQLAKDAKRKVDAESRIEAQWGAWIHSLQFKGKSADGTKDYYYDPRDNRWFGIKTIEGFGGPRLSICQIYACAMCGKGALSEEFPGYCSEKCQDAMIEVIEFGGRPWDQVI